MGANFDRLESKSDGRRDVKRVKREAELSET